MQFEETTDKAWVDVTQTDKIDRMTATGYIKAIAARAPASEIDTPEVRLFMRQRASLKRGVVDAWWEEDTLYAIMYAMPPISLRTQSLVDSVAIKPIRIENIITALDEIKDMQDADPSDSGPGVGEET